MTIKKLRSGDHEYLAPEQVSGFDLYLSFTGGPALAVLREEFGARRPEAFFCFVDPEAHRPLEVERRWTLNYLGTYSQGRQPGLAELLLAPARRRPAERFAVAGPMFPATIRWPENVERIEHLAPDRHPSFYGSCAYTLNITRLEMRALGHCPSVRLFEAAAAGAPVISDTWPGLETLFTPGEEIFPVHCAADVERVLDGVGEERRAQVAQAARRRVLREHTAARRAQQLHDLVGSLSR